MLMVMQQWRYQKMRERSSYRYYGDTSVSPFSADNLGIFVDLLYGIGIGDDEANEIFRFDYEDARTYYTDEEICIIVRNIFKTNFRKYEKFVDVWEAEYDPIENYSMTETMTDTRTPNLTATTSSSATSTSKINQSQTTTDTPNNYAQTSVRSVNPYDNTGFRTESQNVTTDTGSRTTSVSYSGDPDSATTSTSSTATNTGTETVAHTGSRSGNIGVTTAQQMLESEILLADKMNFFKEIEKDVAAKIFIGAW